MKKMKTLGYLFSIMHLTRNYRVQSTDVIIKTASQEKAFHRNL